MSAPLRYYLGNVAALAGEEHSARRHALIGELDNAATAGRSEISVWVLTYEGGRTYAVVADAGEAAHHVAVAEGEEGRPVFALNITAPRSKFAAYDPHQQSRR